MLWIKPKVENYLRTSLHIKKRPQVKTPHVLTTMGGGGGGAMLISSESELHVLMHSVVNRIKIAYQEERSVQLHTLNKA